MKSSFQADADTLGNATRSLCGQDFHATDIPMWVFDKKSLEFLTINRAAIEHYGFSQEEFLAMSILDIRPAEDVDRLVRETMFPHAHNSEPECWRHVTRAGRVFPVEITSHEIIFAGRPAELIIARECAECGFEPEE